MRYYITIFALAPAVSLLPFEHVQAHYLRIDSNKGECAAILTLTLYLLYPRFERLSFTPLPTSISLSLLSFYFSLSLHMSLSFIRRIYRHKLQNTYHLTPSHHTEKSLQYDSTHDEYGRRLRSRQLSTPIGHGWAFGEDSKEQAPRAAAAAVEKGDKATPMGHGWAIGEDEKKEIVTAHVIAAAAAAALDGDKVHTPMGHGWSFEGPAKGMDVAFP